MRKFDIAMNRAFERLKLQLGDIYESCSYHPVLCLGVDYKKDEVWGVSLIDGTYPLCCSLVHCGVRKLTPRQAWQLKMSGPRNPEERDLISEEKRWWNGGTEKTFLKVKLVGPRKPPRAVATKSKPTKGAARAKPGA